jgi:hypothetical protein
MREVILFFLLVPLFSIFILHIQALLISEVELFGSNQLIFNKSAPLLIYGTIITALDMSRAARPPP